MVMIFGSVTFKSCVAIGMRFEIQDGTKIIVAERRALVRTETLRS